MIEDGDLVNGRYKVQGLCNDSGGMGALFYVSDTTGEHAQKLVLKYCRETQDEQIKRFKREVRLLNGYKGNSKVVQLFDFDLGYDPPYFVMKYYEDGDLTNIIDQLNGNLEKQESVFLNMIDCISELHSRDQYHRDIKPQNFLIDGDAVLVSDFGLSMEIESGTGFTKSSMYWGTHGYLPPEFLNHGGFKNADAAGDIFMLGKSFYVLLTNRDPLYLLSDGIESPLFHIIERACSVNKSQRYQSLADLKQNIVMAYDVLLHRSGVFGETQQLLTTINDRLEQDKRYSSKDVIEFIKKLAFLEVDDKIRICFEVERRVYAVLRQSPVVAHLKEFLDVYSEMVDNKEYSWGYAEIIVSNMKVLFSGEDVPNQLKSRALELAINAAYRMHRFAAMDLCVEMIKSITNDALGVEVAAVILRNRDTFIESIEPSECKSEAIRNAINTIKTND